jgi:hypothetical protein
MDGRLACQTDVTPDARDLYRRVTDECELDGDCGIDLRLRGAPMALLPEDDEGDQRDDAGTVISLARAVLALGQRGDARAIKPGRADADLDVDFGN